GAKVDILITVDSLIDCALAARRGRMGRSERVAVGFAGADAHRLVEAVDEDLAVADLPGAGGGGDRLDGLVGELVGHGDLDLDLGKEVHGVLGTAIDLGVPLLAPVALDFGD